MTELMADIPWEGVVDDPRPTHRWNGIEGHNCQDCPYPSLWRCSPEEHPAVSRDDPERSQDEHDHRRAFCACGELLFDGWLSPDGTTHACEFWPPPETVPV